MIKTAILIPSHLRATRLPNKPLLEINNEPMIVHCWRRAKDSNCGDVYVATPDKEIADVISKAGGKYIFTKKEHQTGTDRIFEAVNNFFREKPNYIINLQGDMPNISIDAIKMLKRFIEHNTHEFATLASNLSSLEQYNNKNIVKVIADKTLSLGNYSNAVDFFRIGNEKNFKNSYHHIGMYACTFNALKKFVSLERSRNEIDRSLEQMRVLDNKIQMAVGLINTFPLGVDTVEDLEKIRKIMGNG